MARIGDSGRSNKFLRVGMIWLIALSLASGSRAASADDVDENPAFKGIPKVGQPSIDFYNAAGSDVGLIAKASPTELSTTEWLTFTLTINHLTNAADVEKPSLKKLKDFDAFQVVDESPDLDPKLDPNVRDRRTFVYKLRPSSEKIKLIPEIGFHYYDPKAKFPDGKPQLAFRKSFSNYVPIRVKPPDTSKHVAKIPLSVPDFATRVTPIDGMLEYQSTETANWVWALALVIPPLLAVGWFLAWRSIYPDAARLIMLKRSRTVRRALSALSSAKRQDSVEAAGAIATALVEYLHERFDLPVFARTPREIADHLKTTNCEADQIDAAAQIFRSCDAARFSSAQADVPVLANDVECLIIALEGNG